MPEEIELNQIEIKFQNDKETSRDKDLTQITEEIIDISPISR